MPVDNEALGDGAFEIHNYANTEVAVPQPGGAASSASAASSPQSSGRLNDVVLKIVTDRLGHTELTTYNAVMADLDSWIQINIIPNQREKHCNAIQKGMHHDADAKHQLRRIYSFMKIFHPESMDAWIRGFVSESVTAYDAGPTSCAKGVVERIVTGLRGVNDAELDPLFAQAERIQRGKILMKSLDISKPGSLSFIVSKLKTLDITKGTEIDEAISNLRENLTAEIKGLGLSKEVHPSSTPAHRGTEADFMEQLETMMDLIEGQYDEIIRNLLPDAKLAGTKQRRDMH